MRGFTPNYGHRAAAVTAHSPTVSDKAHGLGCGHAYRGNRAAHSGNYASQMRVNERRRSVREPREFQPESTWVWEAGQNCVILDVSEYGARIMVKESGASLPKEIWLFLNPTGTRRRRCRVIWRSEDQIGVSYLGSWETREPEN